MPYNRYDIKNKYNRRGRRFNERTWVTTVLLIVMPIIMVAVVLVGILLPVKFTKDERPVVVETTTAPVSEEDIVTDELLLRIVNDKNPLEADFMPNLVSFGNVQVSSAIYTDLKNMIDAAKSDGVVLTVTTGYISYEQQNVLYNDTYEKLKSENDYSKVKAESETMKICPQAGNSENQTGLLVTFSTTEEGEFSATNAGKWLEKYCVNYGFVLRYPEDKEVETGRQADDATYRYVGVDHAKQMRSYDMYLEEYVKHINQR